MPSVISSTSAKGLATRRRFETPVRARAPGSSGPCGAFGASAGVQEGYTAFSGLPAYF